MKHQIRSQFDCKAKLAIWGTERPLKCVKEAIKSSPHLCLIGLKFANFMFYMSIAELANIGFMANLQIEGNRRYKIVFF